MQDYPYRSTRREYVIHVPTAFNSGERISDLLRRRAEDMICERFRGFHVDRGHEGRWIARDGTAYRDVIDVYWIAVDSDREIIGLAREIGLLLGQRAMYVLLPDNYALVIDPTGRSVA